jgi:hypothetical protein
VDWIGLDWIVGIAEMAQLRAFYLKMIKDGTIQVKEGQWVAVYYDGSHKVASTAEEVISGRTDDCNSIQYKETEC